jgi:signal peptidase II
MLVYVLSAREKKRRPRLAIETKRLLGPLLLILLVIILADQITKIWATDALKDNATAQIMGDFIQLRIVYNIGGAMGTALGNSVFYLISSILILVVVLYLAITNISNKFFSLPLVAIAGGAVGNIIDRIRIGKVIDFIDVDIPDINLFGFKLERWWTFNVADAAITVGMIFLLAYIIFGKREKAVGETNHIPK